MADGKKVNLKGPIAIFSSFGLKTYGAKELISFENKAQQSTPINDEQNDQATVQELTSCLTEDQVQYDDDDDYDDELFDNRYMDDNVLVDLPIKSISNTHIYSSKSDSFELNDPPKKRTRLTTIFSFFGTYDNKQECLAVILAENTWNRERTRDTIDGAKVKYQCKDKMCKKKC